jgi:K+-transporting ATPase ATPase C chain
MFIEILRQIKTSFIILLFFTLLTGIIYPLIVTGVAQLIFPWKANGSIIENNGKSIGSLLIGQSFADPRYFYSRPSATLPFPYNGGASLGSNMGPSNPLFIALVKERALNFQTIDSSNLLVPVDLVTASGSGLDPDISPYAAFYQIQRIAKLRNIPEIEIKQVVEQLIQGRQWGIFGEPRVNVLQLNLALDALNNSEKS